MLTRFVLSLVLSFFAAPLFTANAQPQEIPNCESFGLGGLYFQSVPGLEDETDYCVNIRNMEPVPDPVRNVARQVQSLHEKIAELWGLSVKDLFNPSPRLFVVAGQSGPFASAFGSGNNRPTVLMGVFPSWDRVSINEPIYVHEIGHYITYIDNPHLPKSLHYFLHIPLMTESIADYMAMAITGAVTEGSELPGCLSSARKIKGLQSYDGPRGYFDDFFATRRVITCCKSHLMNSIRAENRDINNMCEQYIGVVGTDLPLFDRRKLDPQYDRFGLDSHQIGIPLNSFINNLMKWTGRSVQERFPIVSTPLYFQAIENASEKFRVDPKGPAFQCRIVKSYTEPDTMLYQQTVYFPSLKRIMEEFKNLLSLTDKEVFDRYWEKHGIDIGVQLGESQVSPGNASDILLGELGQKLQTGGRNALPETIRGCLVEKDDSVQFRCPVYCGNK